MAITRITKGVIKPNENYDTHNIVSTGIITSVGADINGDLDVDGHTNLDNVSISGVTTFAGSVSNLVLSGIVTTTATAPASTAAISICLSPLPIVTPPSHVVPELFPVHNLTSFMVTLYTAAFPLAAKAFFETNKNKMLNNIIYIFFILICSGYL